MTQFTVHKNKFIDVPFTVFDDINASPPVVNATATATVDCPSGKCQVSIVTTDNRKVAVKGLTETAGQPVNVIVTANGKSATFTMEVLAEASDGRAVTIGTSASAEYDGPAH